MITRAPRAVSQNGCRENSCAGVALCESWLLLHTYSVDERDWMKTKPVLMYDPYSVLDDDCARPNPYRGVRNLHEAQGVYGKKILFLKAFGFLAPEPPVSLSQGSPARQA